MPTIVYTIGKPLVLLLLLLLLLFAAACCYDTDYNFHINIRLSWSTYAIINDPKLCALDIILAAEK